MSFKRTKVVMLPTNQRAGKISMGNTSLKLDYHMLPIEKGGIYTNHTYQHLYFLSDEEIKVGDWWIDLLENRIFQVTEEDVIVTKVDGLPHNGFKKIIATTDRLRVITKDEFSGVDNQHLPQPSEGFIQKFVDSYNSGNQISEVDVEYNHLLTTFGVDEESLKINPKDNTITIKKAKDSWTRDEVVTLILQSNLDSHVAREGEFDIMHWIAENL